MKQHYYNSNKQFKPRTNMSKNEATTLTLIQTNNLRHDQTCQQTRGKNGNTTIQSNNYF